MEAFYKEDRKAGGLAQFPLASGFVESLYDILIDLASVRQPRDKHGVLDNQVGNSVVSHTDSVTMLRVCHLLHARLERILTKEGNLVK